MIWRGVGSTWGAGHPGATFKKGHVGDVVTEWARVGLRPEQELVQGLAHLHQAVGEEVEVGDGVTGQALQQRLLLPRRLQDLHQQLLNALKQACHAGACSERQVSGSKPSPWL